LRSAFGQLRANPRTSEQPDDYQPGETLDQRVSAKTNKRDRPSHDAGTDRNCELDEMPTVATPGQEPRAPLKPLSLETR